MARSVNKVMLIGNPAGCGDQFTPSGQARTTFSIATTRQWKDRQTGENKEQTDWHNIVAWGKERVADYLKKGKQIYVEGRLTTRSYENNEGKTTYITEVIADDIVLLGGGGDDGGGYSGGQGRQSRGDDMGGHHDQSSNFSASDDDIPF